MAHVEKAGALVTDAEQVPARPVKAGRATEMQVLIGPEHGAPRFAMRRFRMGVGGGMPLHANSVEHEQYVLCGRAAVRIGETTHEVRPGSVLFIPAGIPHSYEVRVAPFEFLCLVPNVEDRIAILPDAAGSPPSGSAPGS